MQIQCPKCKQWFEDENENGKCDLCGADLSQNGDDQPEMIDPDVAQIVNRRKYYPLRCIWFSLPIVFIAVFFGAFFYFNDYVQTYGKLSHLLNILLGALLIATPFIFFIWFWITLWHAFGGHKFLKFLPGASSDDEIVPPQKDTRLIIIINKMVCF